MRRHGNQQLVSAPARLDHEELCQRARTRYKLGSPQKLDSARTAAFLLFLWLSFTRIVDCWHSARLTE